MRRIGYGIIGILLGIIIYILLLTQLPMAAEVKSTLADFNTSGHTEDYIEPSFEDDLKNEEDILENEEDVLATKPLLEYGSYHVSVSDFKNYENKGVVKYGKVNPMFYFIKQIIAPDNNENSESGIPGVPGTEVPKNPDNPGPTNPGNDNVHEGKGGNKETYHLGFNIETKKEEIQEVSKILKDFKQYGKLPVDKEYYNITSGFGSRTDPFKSVNAFHTGIDIANVGINKTNVYSVIQGEVLEAVTNPNDKDGYGTYVVIKHDGYETLYGHLDSIADIKPGDKVYAGTIIGKVGNTGRSTGPHVHFEVRVGSNTLNGKLFIDEFR